MEIKSSCDEKKEITSAVKSAVNAYLLARAHANTMREIVNKYYKEALEIYPLYTDRHKKAEQIYDVKRMYLSEDEQTCEDVYNDVEYRLRRDGIKPPEMPDGQCPALVAESIQRDAENLIIEATGEMLGMDIDSLEIKTRLLHMGKYYEYIDLVCKLVVNLPDFKNPLNNNP